MTEKEKAEAYDEAIERAKKWHNIPNPIYCNIITEKIFPELKENDTERIRKNCIHFLKLQKQHHAAIFEIEECIDWLEKQREQEEHKFKVGDKLIQNKFDPKTLQPFDRVMVRDGNNEAWSCTIFSHLQGKDCGYPYNTASGIYVYCIPYNDDTKHLAGTTEEAPEYYRYWEE